MLNIIDTAAKVAAKVENALEDAEDLILGTSLIFMSHFYPSFLGEGGVICTINSTFFAY